MLPRNIHFNLLSFETKSRVVGGDRIMQIRRKIGTTNIFRSGDEENKVIQTSEMHF